MRTTLSDLARVFTHWITDASPWLQGLFGGAGATLLWEGFFKPRRERRALAHVLAEEIGLNLELAANMLAMFAHNPKGVPQDFRFLTTVYESVVSRIGELPTKLVGEVVLMYAGMRAVNSVPDQFAATLDRRDELAARAGESPSAGVVLADQRKNAERELEIQLRVFKSSVAKALERANAVLPRLRRSAVPFWRLDYYVRRKKYLSLEDSARKVAVRARELGFGTDNTAA